MQKKIITIKIGGKLAIKNKILSVFISEVKRLLKNYNFLLVHGGGIEITKRTQELGLKPVFMHGLRITTPAEMDIVDEVLSGRVNSRLVRLLQSCGINAVGLNCASGKIIIGKCLDFGDKIKTCTGTISQVETALLALLLENNYVPVLSSPAMDKKGKALNINADATAFAVATHLKSDYLLFFSDIPGVLKQEKVISALPKKQALQEIKAGTISGGMIPKIEAAIAALKQGVAKIIIGEYSKQGNLKALLEGKKGTQIY